MKYKTEHTMRLMFLQSVPYGLEARGASRSTWFLVEEMLQRGHVCMVAAPSLSLPSNGQWLQCPKEMDISPAANFNTNEVEIYQLGPVTAVISKNPAKLAATVLEQINEFAPDWVLVSSEYPQQMFLLKAALQGCPDRVIYLSHATHLLPFGPKSFAASISGVAMLRKVAGIITVSQYLRGYIRRWSGLESVVLPFPVFGRTPYTYNQLGSYTQGGVMIINPCAYKGISIFISLADAFPTTPFIAIPSWGTTSEDRNILQTIENVQIVEPMYDLEKLYAQARVLIVPSLGEEAFGYVATEAMLRGIPVIASNIGGIPEAKLGVDYILPVTAIEHYENRFDEQKNPIPIIPPQDIQPWLHALHRLLSDEEHYEQLSAFSRKASEAFVTGISIEAYEDFFNELTLKTFRKSGGVQFPQQGVSERNNDLAGLSPNKRALIASLLSRKRGNS